MAKSDKVDRKILEYRSYKIVKANDLIQRSRFNLQMQEQKIILYLISKIKPEDIVLKEQIFQIRDFCKVCGLETDSGMTYNYIRQTLKDLRDKSVWVTLDDGSEVILSWIDTVKLNKQSGEVSIKISEMIKPYLLQLKEHYTQYELLYTLAMKSRYSLRLYELLKSYEYQHSKIFDIEELKKLLSADNYTRFPDFKRKVLDIAMYEINNLSDLIIEYAIVKESRRFAKLQFSIKRKKELGEKAAMWAKITEKIDGKGEL